MDRLYLPYRIAQNLISEGDILLFRGDSFISTCIQRVGGGEYSHCALASWSGENGGRFLECVEFREFRGARTVTLESQVNTNPSCIDVFRITSPFKILKPEIDKNGKFIISEDWISYRPKLITNEMRRLGGLDYSYKRIFFLLLYYLPFSRWLLKPDIEDNVDSPLMVCSTSLAMIVRKYYTDLVKFRADRRTEPSDISRSALLTYIFTIKKDW